MTAKTQRDDRSPRARRRRAAGGALALAVAVVGLAGCSVVSAVNKIAHDVDHNKATIDAFTSKIQSTEATPFQATYETSGSSPATVVYAVQPPTDLAVTITPTSTAAGSQTTKFIVNSSGEYLCTPPSTAASSGSTWTCEKLPPSDAADESDIVGFYTPSHWVTFLNDAALVAGIAGDKVTTSTMTVNGFPMSCVDLVAQGVPGTSTVCTTQQNILGYAKSASDSTSFAIKAYSASPSPALFQLPAGAKVTTVTVPSTTTTTS